MNEIDWFSEISTVLAVVATIAALFAVAFEFRSRRRKLERDRIVSLIEERMPDRGSIPDAALADIEAFVNTRLSKPELWRKLSKDLHDLAMLAIISMIASFSKLPLMYANNLPSAVGLKTIESDGLSL